MKRLPIGVEDFKELVDHQYYYIDKIMFIQLFCIPDREDSGKR